MLHGSSRNGDLFNVVRQHKDWSYLQSIELKFVIVTGVVLGHLLDCIKADTRVPAAEQKSELISAIHV